jgi:hypothetical protein
VSRRYSGRTARTSGGLGFLPVLLLAVIALVLWNQHGGHVPGLSSVHAAIFG